MDLKAARTVIDEIDRDIAKLLLMRFKITHNIGEYKNQNNFPIYNRERENEIMNNVSNFAEIYGDEVAEIYNTILRVSREEQRR